MVTKTLTVPRIKYDPMGSDLERLAGTRDGAPERVERVWRKVDELCDRRARIAASVADLEQQKAQAQRAAESAAARGESAREHLAAVGAADQELRVAVGALRGVDEQLDVVVDELGMACTAVRPEERAAWLAPHLGKIEEYRARTRATFAAAVDGAREAGQVGGLAAWIALPALGQQPGRVPHWSIDGYDAEDVRRALEPVSRSMDNSDAVSLMRQLVGQGGRLPEPEPDPDKAAAQRRVRRAAYGRPGEDWDDA